MASKRVTELLKKLLAGRSAAESGTPLSTNLSFCMGLSPSKVANAKFARTGAGAGTVLNPDTGISTLTELLIALKPSKLVIDLPGRVGS